jgi:hypothetical protein
MAEEHGKGWGKSPWNPEDRPRKVDSAFRRYGEQAWVVRLKDPSNTLLNEVAARVFELLDGRNRVQDVVQTVSSEFEVDPDQARQDVLEFLDELRANDLLA